MAVTATIGSDVNGALIGTVAATTGGHVSVCCDTLDPLVASCGGTRGALWLNEPRDRNTLTTWSTQSGEETGGIYMAVLCIIASHLFIIQSIVYFVFEMN